EHDAVVNVRIISASNRDPQEAVAAGVLREDLFYRLRVVPIKLPPLRERLADIAFLANHFLLRYWERHRGVRVPPPRFTDECVKFLQSRHWRGNVRELQNVIEHVAVIVDPEQAINPDDIPAEDERGQVATETLVPSAVLREGYHDAKDKVVA